MRAGASCSGALLLACVTARTCLLPTGSGTVENLVKISNTRGVGHYGAAGGPAWQNRTVLVVDTRTVVSFETRSVLQSLMRKFKCLVEFSLDWPDGTSQLKLPV